METLLEVQSLLRASGDEGLTLDEAAAASESLRVTRPEELRAAFEELVTDGLATKRGARNGYAVHISTEGSGERGQILDFQPRS